MKSLFIIPCAIMVGDDQNVHFERYFQLMHTIDSIKSRFSNAEIWVLELSGNRMSDKLISLLSKDCSIIHFNNSVRLHAIKERAKTIDLRVSNNIRKPYELGYIKNATECMSICTALSLADPKKYDRIFKITGRYFLSNAFNIDEHNVYGKFTLKEKIKCSHGKEFTGSDYIRHCMYWSFCTSIYDEVLKIFNDIDNYIDQCEKNRIIPTIENGLEIFTNPNIINDIKKTGVFGIVDNKYPYMD